MPNGTHRFDDGRTYPIPIVPYESHRGGPENVEQYEVVEPFGDERDDIVLRVIRGEDAKPRPRESFISWLRRRKQRWS